MRVGQQAGSHSDTRKPALWLSRLLTVMESRHIWERIPWLVITVRLLMVGLYGPEAADHRAKMWLVRVLTGMFGVLCGGAILSSITMSWGCLDLALCVFILIPVVSYRRLKEHSLARKRRLLTELPDLLFKLTLLVQAGETIQQALHRAASQGHGDSPLSEQLKRLSRELRDSRPFPAAMEGFSKRCAIPEVAMMSTTVLLHYRRGGSDLTVALQEMARTIAERRRALVQTMGEEASAKLVFPMAVLFLVVTVLVAAPAVLLMNGNS